MSAVVEQRVVEMQFDNQSFEKNARQSIKTIDNLNKSVNSLGAEGSGLSKLVDTITVVTQKFSALEQIAIGVFQNIGARASIASEELLRTLTIDQVSSGWGKYEEETRAVQTIMSATGRSIEDVYEQLEKLMWFTDETSYNFVDMTSNIGKFTSQGIGLEEATTAMMGISNWAAKAGQGANEASRAMYNLAQALGAGYVKAVDWMSVVNANMDTMEFKNLAIEIAKAFGTISEAGLDATGALVTAETFASTLTQGKWFTTDVLMKTLEEYGDYTELIHEIVEATGLSASEAMRYVTGMYDGVGEAAFKAGQEAKTFTDVIDATTDAASTQWLKTFRIIFGNYEQAKVMWTDLANAMNEFFVGPAYDRNDMLMDWADLGGREVLIQALADALTKVVEAVNFIKGAWQDVFPPMTAERLNDYTNKFAEFVDRIQFSEGTINNLRDVLTGLFSVIKIGVDSVSTIANALSPMTEQIGIFLSKVLVNLAELGRSITNFANSEKSFTTLRTIVSSLAEAFGQLFAEVNSIVDVLSKIGNFGITQIVGIVNSLANALTFLKSAVNDITPDVPMFSFFDAFKDFLSNASLADVVTSILQGIAAAIRNVGAVIESLFDVLSKAADSVLILNLITLLNYIKLFLKDFKNSVNPTLGIVDTFKNMLNTISGTIGSFKQNADIKRLLSVAAAIAILSISMKLLASVDSEALMFATSAMAAMFAMLTQTNKALAGVGQLNISFLTMAESVYILSLAMSNLAELDVEGLVKGIAGVGVLMAEIVGMTKLMQGMSLSGGIGSSILAIALALDFLTLPILILGSMPLENLAKGVGAIAVTLASFVVALRLLENIGPQIMASGAAITMMSAGLTVLSIAIAGLSFISLEGLAKGVGTITVALYAMVGALALLNMMQPQNLLAAGGALLAISVGMDFLAVSIAALSLIPWQKLVMSVGAIVVSLAAMTAALMALSTVGPMSLASAGALTLLAVALDILTPSLAVLSVLPWQGLVAGVLALAAGLGVLVGAAYLAVPVIPAVLALSAALVALGVAISLPIIAIGALAAGFGILLASFSQFTSLSDEEMEQAADNIIVAIDSIIQAFGRAKGEILMIIFYIIQGILEAISSSLVEITRIAVEFIVGLAELIAQNADRFIAAIVVILEAIRDHIPEFLKVLGEIVVAIIRGLGEMLFNALGELVDTLLDVIPDFVKKIVNKVKSVFGKEAPQTGAEFGEGVAVGIASTQKKVESTSETLGLGVIDTLNDTLGTHSVSDVSTISGYEVGMGLVEGMNNSLPYVVSMSQKMGLTLIKNVESGIGLDTGKPEQVGEQTIEQIIAGIVGKHNELRNMVTATGSDAGEAFVSGVDSSGAGGRAAGSVAKGISASTAIEDAAKEKAEAFANAFSQALTSLDLASSRIESKYNIAANLLGPEDTAEKALAETQIEMARLRESLINQATKVHIENDKFRNMMEQFKEDQTNYSEEDIMSAYTDYISELEKLTSIAADIAAAQYDAVDSREQAEQAVFAQMNELAQQRAELMKHDQAIYEGKIAEANENYLNAVTETQKEYYKQVLDNLNSMTPEEIYGPLVANPPDISEIRKEIYSALGISPENAQESWMDVTEIVHSAVEATKEGYIYAVEESYSDLINTYGLMIGETAEEMVNAVDEQTPVFAKAGARMAEAITEGLEGGTDDMVLSASIVSNEAATMLGIQVPDQWVDVGLAMMDGLVEGIRQGRSAVINAAVEVAEAAAAAAMAALGISSPSKVFARIGRYAVEGLSEGLATNAEISRNASEDVVNETLRPFEDLSQRVTDILSNELDPTIRPVIDMEGVTTGVHDIDKLMNQTGRSFTSKISATEQAKEYRNLLKSMPKKEEPSIVNNNFTQNNYSPKALSDADIYRQTQNELRWALRRTSQ